VKVGDLYCNQELIVMATKPLLTLLVCRVSTPRDSPFLVAPHVALPLQLYTPLFVAPILLFLSSTHMQRQKKRKKK
jgi:hypothetical protein